MLDDSSFKRVLIEPPPSSIEEDYCCHAYSLKVHKDSEILKFHNEIFVELITINGVQQPWRGFRFLGSKGLLKKIEDENNDNLRDDDIILYFNDKDFLVHSGRMKNGRVISKWGGRSIHPLTKEKLIGEGVWKHNWNDIEKEYCAGYLNVRARFIRLNEGVTKEDIKRALLEYRDKILTEINRSN